MKSLESYDALRIALADWKSFADDDIYDANGAMGLLQACAANLGRHAVDGDFDAVFDIFNSEDIRLLQKIIEEYNARTS
jgi:hypothetical protein